MSLGYAEQDKGLGYNLHGETEGGGGGRAGLGRGCGSHACTRDGWGSSQAEGSSRDSRGWC